MLQISGTYHNGILHLDKNFTSKNPVKIVVTFVDEVEVEQKNELTLSDFTFFETQELLKEYKGSFSDEVISERRSEL